MYQDQFGQPVCEKGTRFPNELKISALVAGSPIHHYFGILGNHITFNAAGISSAVISSRRVGVGRDKEDREIINYALTRHQFNSQEIGRAIVRVDSCEIFLSQFFSA